MTTQEKLQVALSLIRSLQFQQDEKMSLVQSIVEELGLSASDLLRQYDTQIKEIVHNSVRSVLEAFSKFEPQTLEARNDFQKEIGRKTQNETNSKEKPIKLNKNGLPRKPYTRRNLSSSVSKPKSEENLGKKDRQETKEKVNESSTQSEISEQKADEANKSPDTCAEPVCSAQPASKEMNVSLGKLLLLYQNPNNNRALIISEKILPESRIMGVVVPYLNSKETFGVSLFEEKSIMILKKAQAKAKSFPKFFGNEWEILNERQKKSLIAIKTQLNKVLQMLHGDPIHEHYLMNSYMGKNTTNTRIRYTIALPDVTLEK